MEEYTNRELGLLMKDLKEVNSTEHQEITKRLDYTNGKVRNLMLWRAYLTGGITVLAFVFSLLASVVLAR